ncbi:MAG: hypothetical protein GXP58_10225 [Deltaproteobacteria bacterium]|nr:hypothetical protein [Deltaproteobacteria bacterium]
MLRIRNLLLLIIIFSFFFAPAVGFAESRIFLKDGRVIKVDNFWREEGMVKYESLGGIVGIPMSEVEKIVTPDMVAFTEVKKKDTIADYEAFLHQFPKSEFASLAEDRIMALQFEEVKRIDTAPVYLDYIRRNPNSLFLDEAKNRAEVLVFQDAVRTNHQEKFQEYLKIYPEGRFVDAAKKALELITLDHLLKTGTISDLRSFAGKVSDSALQKRLQDRIHALQKSAEQRRERKLQQQAQAAQRAAVQARAKHHHRMLLLWGVGLVAVVGLAVFLVLLRKWKTVKVITEDDRKPAVPEPEEPSVPQKASAGVRYEDLVGAPKRSGSMALPGPEGASASGMSGPAALPEPGRPEGGGDDEGEEESFFLNDTQKQEAAPAPESPEDVISLGYDAGEENGASSEKEVVDLSDPETDLKLELEEVSEEDEAPCADPPVPGSERVYDFSDGDLPDLMDDDERKKRRGGGRT